MLISIALILLMSKTNPCVELIMNVRILYVVLLGTIFIGLCNSVPLNTNETEARQFLEKVNETLTTYNNKVSYDEFNFDKEFNKTAKDAQILVGISNELKAFDYTQFKDKNLRYIFENLRNVAFEAVVGEKRYAFMLAIATGFYQLPLEPDIGTYMNQSALLAYVPEIENIIAKTNDSEELKYYWTEWRHKTYFAYKRAFAEVIDIIRDAANLTDMSPTDFWLSEYNITEMEHVMDQLKPLYQQLHAFIRNQLVKKYGEDVIKTNGPIPDHLFEQVLAQIWTNQSVIEEIYPHRDLPPYGSILEKNNYDALKLYKTAEKFYESLGFQRIPDDLWGTQIKMNSEPDESYCEANIFDESPNVYMKYCHKTDYKTLLQAHGNMGRLIYALEKKDLPAYSFASHNLEYAVGEAVMLSASATKHLNVIDLVTNVKFSDEVLMNKLLRMGIHTLLTIPMYFVQVKSVFDLLADNVEINRLNKHYWKLMDKYVGVESPVDRYADHFDFPHQFYSDFIGRGQLIEMDAEVLGYQIYQKLCEISGQYPKEALQNCDFYGSKSAGDALKKMIKLGSSKPYREVLATFLPEQPYTNAERLLEYYSPMKTWLTERNKKTNVKVGWTATDKLTP